MNEENRPPTTTDAGIPVASQEHSLTVGPDGPVLLQDFYLIEQMANFNRERIPERQPHAKGGGAFGTFQVIERRQPVHEGRRVPARHRDRHGHPVLHRRRRAGLARHLAGPPGLRAEVLHDRGQPRHRRQQHADLLHQGPDEVPELHPLPEAARRQQPARRRHAVGLLDALPGVVAHAHLAHGRPGHPPLLATHERVLVAHLHVGQRRERAVLGQVPLQDRPGHRVPHPGRCRPHRRRGRRLPPAGPLQRHRARRVPELDAEDADHAVRGGQDLPVQPLRSHEGVAARRLPADRRRDADAEPQRHRLPHRDGAGGLPAQQRGARHRPVARQDAAGPRLLLRRRPPRPSRCELPADPGQPPEVARAQLLEGRGDAGGQR